MQNISPQLEAALRDGTTNLCRIWKLTLANGQVFRFTDLTTDITFGGEVFVNDPGVRVSSIVLSSGGQSDNAQVEVRSDASFLSLNRIRQGALKQATFELWVIDYRNPDFYGPLALFAGGMSETTFVDKGRVDIGLNSDIGGGTTKNIGDYYQSQCRALLGDAKCKVNINAIRVAFTVDTITDNGYSITAPELVGSADNFFTFGKVTWLTGLNQTLSDEVKSSTSVDGKLRFSLYPRNLIVPGDTAYAYPGCDFQITTCALKFNNAVNFRGEPYVPPPSITIFSGFVMPMPATSNYLNSDSFGRG